MRRVRRRPRAGVQPRGGARGVLLGELGTMVLGRGTYDRARGWRAVRRRGDGGRSSSAGHGLDELGRDPVWGARARHQFAKVRRQRSADRRRARHRDRRRPGPQSRRAHDGRDQERHVGHERHDNHDRDEDAARERFGINHGGRRSRLALAARARSGLVQLAATPIRQGALVVLRRTLPSFPFILGRADRDRLGRLAAWSARSTRPSSSRPSRSPRERRLDFLELALPARVRRAPRPSSSLRGPVHERAVLIFPDPSAGQISRAIEPHPAPRLTPQQE